MEDPQFGDIVHRLVDLLHDFLDAGQQVVRRAHHQRIAPLIGHGYNSHVSPRTAGIATRAAATSLPKSTATAAKTAWTASETALPSAKAAETTEPAASAAVAGLLLSG